MDESIEKSTFFGGKKSMKQDAKQDQNRGKKRDRTAYFTAYKRQHYDRVVVEYPAGYRDHLKQVSAARGLSLQGMFRAAVAAYIGEPEPGADPEPGSDPEPEPIRDRSGADPEESGDASSQNI